MKKIKLIFVVCVAMTNLLMAQTHKKFVDKQFFNGENLTDWSGDDGYWTLKRKTIVGFSSREIPSNEFIWSNVEVKDFYLMLEVKLDPENRNAGIQFRSKQIGEHGEAYGYQADIGKGLWGKIYHENGRKKLAWGDKCQKVVKRDKWNRYEILAVGDRIWTAVNGELCSAIKDPNGERSGYIALQIHSGPPVKVSYRKLKLIHNPEIVLAGLNEKQLNSNLILIDGVQIKKQ
ncbi:DUF1080 domain-containing protein [Arenibacter sp. ARW7G5Y1]|uniref:3-keto-disaccharide hydrolase n=1 Tax=Arenibacter sp. ARW7G5Y1 TaxID=2135619 RepID=UPI000D76D358|nr:DUF1080 domain-containing protein [Arenibacter sp. ARW7G5Y1]PXX23781.1 uncharacterized protein DUF1080 [Arenibacter sp. ARW7G5Y1]